MGSEFDAMAGAFSAPAIRQQFAERNPAGEVDEGAVVFRFDDRDDVAVAAILGQEQLSNEFNSKGDWVESFVRDIVIQRSDLPEDITEPPMRAVVTAGGEEYHLANEGHRVDGVSMTIRLARKPLVQENPEFGS